MSDNGQQAPLIERLRSVPAAARVLEHTHNPLGYDTASIPVGALCREAADRIAELEAELARVRDERDAWERRAGDYMDERDTARAERDALRSMYRPEVAWFAGIMEERMRANDHKGGWRGDRPADLMLRLYQEAAELYEEIRPGYSTVPSRVEKEAADVANFAMMIADVCGGDAARGKEQK